MHKTNVITPPSPPPRPPPPSPFKSRPVYSIVSVQRNEKRYCLCLCLNTGGRLCCYAARRKSHTGDRRSQSETRGEGNETKEGRKKNKRGEKKNVSVWISSGLMHLAVQELSELTAKCKLAGTVTQRREPELLGFQFYWHVQIYSADKREIKISLTDLPWQFASLRSGAPTVTNLLSSLSQTPHRPSQLTKVYFWLILHPESEIWILPNLSSCLGRFMDVYGP